MRIQPSTSFSYKNNTSFGMAKLTTKGQELAKQVLNVDFIDFAKLQQPYTKKGMLEDLISKREHDPDKIKKLFKFATTEFEDKNAEFIRMQILPFNTRRKIKQYLAKDHAQCAAMTGFNTDKNQCLCLTEFGTAIVENLLNVFDVNVSNRLVSKNDGIKILDLLRDYIHVDTLLKRTGILTDKAYTKR